MGRINIYQNIVTQKLKEVVSVGICEPYVNGLLIKNHGQNVIMKK